MKTIQLGRPIEIDQETDNLLQSIIEGEGDSFDSKVLRAAVPDRRLFVKFLKRRNLLETPAAKSILIQLGVAGLKSFGYRMAPFQEEARMAKKSKLTQVAVKIGTAMGKADRKAQKVSRAGSLAKKRA